MAELTIEQKAKAYDEAIEKARQLCAYPTTKPFISDLQDIFPELVEESEDESNDERIRKALVELISTFLREHKNGKIHGVYAKDILDWLEKQGETTEINLSEFDSQLNSLLKQFESMSKEEIAGILSFYLNVVRNDGTYKEEKQGEQKPWSEDDEAFLSWCISDIERAKYCRSQTKPELCDIEINWLKNIKDRVQSQPHWKPSEEEIKALWELMRYAPSLSVYTKIQESIESLYSDLKKLNYENK